MPIGSIYLSLTTDNPANLFGGTWERIKDTFLLAAGDTYALGGTGGSATHLHSTADHTLTVNEMPSHNHQYYFDMDSSVNWWIGLASGTAETNNSAIASGPQGRAYTLNIRNTGGGAAHNHGNTGSTSNMPPYLAVYIWKRVS